MPSVRGQKNGIYDKQKVRQRNITPPISRLGSETGWTGCRQVGGMNALKWWTHTILVVFNFTNKFCCIFVFVRLKKGRDISGNLAEGHGQKRYRGRKLTKGKPKRIAVLENLYEPKKTTFFPTCSIFVLVIFGWEALSVTKKGVGSIRFLRHKTWWPWPPLSKPNHREKSWKGGKYTRSSAYRNKNKNVFVMECSYIFFLKGPLNLELWWHI